MTFHYGQSNLVTRPNYPLMQVQRLIMGIQSDIYCSTVLRSTRQKWNHPTPLKTQNFSGELNETSDMFMAL